MHFWVSSSNLFLWSEGAPVQAQEPIATSFFELARISSSFLRSLSLAIAPSTNATSRSLSSFLSCSTRACLNSTRFFHCSQLSFSSSVNTIVLSSQQLKVNHPTLSLFMFVFFVACIFNNIKFSCNQ